MKREIKETVEIPAGIEASIANSELKISKDGKSTSKKFDGFEVKKEDNKLLIHNPKSTKKEKKLIKSFAAHIRNIIKGFGEKYIYQLKIGFVHFPVSVEIKGNEFIIKNFLGEKIPRKAKILPEAEVKIDKDLVTVTSHDKEIAGQTAANIEKATRIKNRDRRIFQDGIFMIKKAKGKVTE